MYLKINLLTGHMIRERYRAFSLCIRMEELHITCMQELHIQHTLIYLVAINSAFAEKAKNNYFLLRIIFKQNLN